ncbi:DnaB-like helicase C-terminal domain-containing protein [Wolbachia endosymbiont of Drosophila aff. chauvacae BK-2020]|uniref:replicative DNA helicase n=2 Tax=Wolbachia TaxID=953 RepID=UPI0023A9A8ED|nr:MULTISPECIES: DnaB-like helicase C-terminal domain-containing protein [unclassified Wolbachia]MDE5059511.1 DnaB-like helicase C-terminal domain-containing protein [Wolbachia endosymbiont of Drosophila burlai]MDE5063994.1 DnaB-like helicase C-terminal domain-containing protein [Wolbachia endosymbiont of Drosophila chauvacae]WOE62323.1 DnaB-like helicase C-terminal domain-containing protein [Wolbachia endosymbiont of Drosophila aff. chauvacae BK-2020]
MDQEGVVRVDQMPHVDEDIKPIIDYFEAYKSYINKLLANNNEIEGITTGIPRLDTITGGLKEGELTVLAARTSIGKTSIALHMALQAAKLLKNQEYVCFFSLEMSANQLINRMISIEVNETINNIIKKQNTELLHKGINQIVFLNILVDNSGNMDLNILKKKISLICRKYKMKCIYIDYLQLLRGSKVTENRTLEVTEISRTLKNIAKDFNIPIIALSQISRKVEDRQNKRPQLADLRESGSIEQDADLVLLLYRENYYKADSNNDLEINVAKNRSGSTGKVTVPYQVNTGRILS